QVVEGEVLEVEEGAEAGTEVVERELAAEAAEPVREAAGVLDVRDQGGLCDLEDQRGWVDSAFGQQALDQGRELRVADRLAGEVDVEDESFAGAPVRFEERDRLTHDPGVDRLDQPEALRGVEKLARLQRLAPVGGLQPQQELVAVAAVGCEIDDRLAVKEEAVLLER